MGCQPRERTRDRAHEKAAAVHGAGDRAWPFLASSAFEDLRLLIKAITHTLVLLPPPLAATTDGHLLPDKRHHHLLIFPAAISGPCMPSILCCHAAR